MTTIFIFLTNIIVILNTIDYNMNIRISKNKERSCIVKSRLKELRARDGYNQTQLAKLANVSRQTISLIEREEYMPSLLIAVRISRIFNEPVESIFIFDEGEL